MLFKKSGNELDGRSFIEDGGQVMIRNGDKKAFEQYMSLKNTSKSAETISLGNALEAAKDNIANILAL